MKISIDNIIFPFDVGVKVLKLKYKKCPFEELLDVWDEIEPASFKEILQIQNLELRRVAFLYYGIEKFTEEAKPTLLKEQKIEKQTSFFINGWNKKHRFEDIYKLYVIDGENVGLPSDIYYVEVKDTSTDRTYKIMVDILSVYRIKKQNSYVFRLTKDDVIKTIEPVDCVAWTFTTDIPEEQILSFYRQGDCLLIKTKSTDFKRARVKRHLTAKEYLEKLNAES